MIRDLADYHSYRVPMPAGSDLKKLGELIKQARELLGWTQPQLAEATEVSRAAIQRYEAGGIPRPDHRLLRKIVEVLNEHRPNPEEYILDPREVAVLLGLVTRDELGLPAEPPRRFSATTEEIIGIFEDTAVSAEEKQALLAFLRARQGQPPTSPAERKAS